MAEALAGQLLKGDYEIFSRGLSVSYGQEANPKSVIAMDREGLDIRGHKAQQFNVSEVKDRTLILTMTRGHRDYLLAYYPGLKGRVHTLLSYVEMPGDIADPFGAGQSVYDACAAQIKKAVMKLEAYIKQQS